LRRFCSVGNDRELVPGLAVERSASGFLVAAAPLLKEERGVVLAARGVDIIYPIAVHRPCLGAGLAADNRPVHAAKIGLPDRGQKRLERDKAHMRARTPQIIKPTKIVGAFDARP